MAEILSQDEVNALLRGISSGAIESEKKEENLGGIKPYDLTSQDRIVRGRMPTLEIINERFARLLRNDLTSALRKVAEITSTSVDMQKFGEFLKNIPLPTSLTIFKMPPLRGYAIFVLDSRLVYNLIDIFFGGTTDLHVKIEGRDFSPIENKLIKKITDMAFNSLKTAWMPVSPIDIEFQRSEINPQFATIVTPTEVVIISRFEVDIEGAVSKFMICIPYSMIEPIKEKLYSGFQSEQLEVDHRWIERFKERLKESELNIRIDLGKTSISSRDFLKIKKGDVIVLDKRIEDPLVIDIENLPKFIAYPGKLNNNLAVKIISDIPLGKEGYYE
ncbi:MAG: flagellar motor switch protein FliM [Deltaproteobacteria bacterium]|jgi:flagellar motor switch protein FliM|uniref:Flagellar motor switch protein FliM n=1 Tax=Candidatus Acidulodesulfobacterium acidiphilum TaxID=2597224 RepID=A0A520X9Z0_9DELT|nr:flagellar motor switch protein FliM [Deltaproteobacteria bacterium]RZV38040.1 MAG: flagellar motor switch protein FliM [Candidatus Acidulodesulfobacterium acidiphilum]